MVADHLADDRGIFPLPSVFRFFALKRLFDVNAETRGYSDARLRRVRGARRATAAQTIRHGQCAVRDDEIIGKRRNFLNIEQEQIFALFFFQGVDQGASNFEICSQVSPHKIDSYSQL